MWSSHLVIGVLLCAGVHSQVLNEYRSIGDELKLSVLTFTNVVHGCYIDTPDSKTLTFKPNEEADYESYDKFVLEPNEDLIQCAVTITRLEEKDTGLWTIYYVSDTKMSGSATYNLTVTNPESEDNSGTEEIDDDSETEASEDSSETESSEDNSEIEESGENYESIDEDSKEKIKESEENEIITEYLPEIEYIIRRGVKVDISLSRKSYKEKCYLHTPKHEVINLHKNEEVGIELKSISNYVSCRVVIGPIKVTKDFIGVWTLCGKTKINAIEHQRCQPVNVQWLVNDPLFDWEPVFEPIYNYGVHFGEIGTPKVEGSGYAQTCHIVTPNGEDLLMTTDSTYPGLERIVNYERGHCSIAIGPIDASKIGRWTIYGIFDSRYGYNEVHLPVNLYLDNSTGNGSDERTEESDKYEIATKWLPQIEFVVRRGSNVDISLSQTSVEETCYLLSPNNETVNLQEEAGFELQSSSDYVSCRVILGPVDEDFIGIWTLCGRSEESGVESQRCQSVNIQWRNNNPAITWTPRTEHTAEYAVHFGGIWSPTVRGSGNIDTCHIITPNGEDLIITTNSTYPGFERIVTVESSICSIAIGPLDEPKLGNWTVYGKFDSIFGYNEVHLPIYLYLYDKENPYDQAYNVTILEPTEHIVNLGSSIQLYVIGLVLDEIDECFYRIPSGEEYTLNTGNPSGVTIVGDESSRTPACRLNIGPITETMLGQWELIGKFSYRGVFTERRLSFNIVQEDPENPIIDDKREIVELERQYINTTMGSTHEFVMTIYAFHTSDSCHIRTPSGLQYTIMEGLIVPGVEPIENHDCGIKLTVVNKDIIGDWTLIFRETRLSSDLLETRLPFTIHVEDIVEALPKQLMVAEKNNFFLRLANPSTEPNTCKLFPPPNIETSTNLLYQTDPNQKEHCGFIVSRAQAGYTGMWEISYGSRITYRAFINVNVVANNNEGNLTLVWVKDHPVSMVVGPEDAVYCVIEDPNSLKVFDGFGPCNITLDKVTLQHNGEWKMIVHLLGRVVAEEYLFSIIVKEKAAKPKVQAIVVKDDPVVHLSCSVSSEYEVKACKFREPSGRVLVASHAIGEDRYTAYSQVVGVQSEAKAHECGIRITNPTIEELGLWRCAMETDQDVFYGFLTVLCPWAMQDPEVASQVISEPTLTADATSLDVEDGESTVLSCSIQSPVQYCYFRSRNGTVFNVGNGGSGSVPYVGAGLDAGECGTRFSFETNDSGYWSCHVGLVEEQGGQEQSVQISVSVAESMWVAQYEWYGVLIVEGHVNGGRQVDYCRFVRIDGTGFSTNHLPNGSYQSNSDLSKGFCSLRVDNPDTLERHPWTIATRIRGQDWEISRVTENTMQLPGVNPPQFDYGYTLLWFLIILIGMMILLAGLFGPKKSRDWTFQRAASVRNSLRSSIQRKPLKALPAPVDEIPKV